MTLKIIHWSKHKQKLWILCVHWWYAFWLHSPFRNHHPSGLSVVWKGSHDYLKTTKRLCPPLQCWVRLDCFHFLPDCHVECRSNQENLVRAGIKRDSQWFKSTPAPPPISFSSKLGYHVSFKLNGLALLILCLQLPMLVLLVCTTIPYVMLEIEPWGFMHTRQAHYQLSFTQALQSLFIISLSLCRVYYHFTMNKY